MTRETYFVRVITAGDNTLIGSMEFDTHNEAVESFLSIISHEYYESCIDHGMLTFICEVEGA